ncbi:hypothetical protein GEMRC1_004889 [Eukaryota sp. GEM-RC1]
MYYHTKSYSPTHDDDDSPFDEDVDMSSESDSLQSYQKQPGFLSFLRGYSVYDVMPDSGKIVLMDPDLSVAQAVGVLVYNEITSLPLWDSAIESFFGMFTVWDLVDILVASHDELYASPGSCPTAHQWYNLVAERSVRSWKQFNPRPLSTVDPSCTLAQALQILRTQSLHRLPVLDDTGTVIHIISPRRIAGFLVSKYRRAGDSELVKTVAELAEDNIGVFEKSALLTCRKTDPLVDILRILQTSRVASLIIVEQDSRGIWPVDIFNTADLIGLVFGSSLPTDSITVEDALKFQLPRREKLHKIKRDTRLKQLLQDSAQHRIHRFVVVDEDDYLVGMLSLGDILKSFGAS